MRGTRHVTVSTLLAAAAVPVLENGSGSDSQRGAVL